MRDWKSLGRARGGRGRRLLPAVAFALALAVPAATFGIPRTVDALDTGGAAVAGESRLAFVVPRECDDCEQPARSSARRGDREPSSSAPERPLRARVTGAKDAVRAAPPVF